MIVTGKWELYVPDALADSEEIPEGALYLKDSYSNDWYEFQSKFRDDTIKILFDDNGNIASVHQDASYLFPINLSVAEVKSLPEDINDTPYVVKKGKLVKKVHSEEEISLLTERGIKRRVNRVGNEIGALTGLSSAGLLTQEQRERLDSLLLYVKEVYGVNKLSPVWPKEP